MIYRKVVELCDSEDDIEDVLALAFDDEDVKQFVPRDPVSGDLMSPRSFMVTLRSVDEEFGTVRITVRDSNSGTLSGSANETAGQIRQRGRSTKRQFSSNSGRRHAVSGSSLP